MALINCPECNREVSDKAEICPNCGFGVAKYIVRQNKILKIQEEAEREAYLYVKQKKKEEREKAEKKEKDEINRKNSTYDEAVIKFAGELSKDVERAKELFSSILGWKDADDYFNKCEDRINRLRQQELIQEENCRRRNKKIIFTTVIVGIFIGITIVGYSFYKMVVVPQNTYESARHNIQNEDYEEAIEKLEMIIDYKDAREQREIALNLEANRLVDEQKYSEALDILKQMKKEENINELINICENSLQYEKAINLAENKEYREAIKILEELDGFKDSVNILQGYRLEADYLDALAEINNENLESAIPLLKKVGDYKDAKEKYNELCYQFGMTEFENQNYKEAKKYLSGLADDKNVADIINECNLQLSYEDLYLKAESLMVGDLLDSAIDYFKQLPNDYKDVADKIKVCNKYKDVVGKWKCVGYETSDKEWITDKSACKKNDFKVFLNVYSDYTDKDAKLLYMTGNEYDYATLEYTGTILKWEYGSMQYTLNTSTGTLTYTDRYVTYKESYVYSEY